MEMDYIQRLTMRYPDLKPIQGEIVQAFLRMKEAFLNKKKLLVAGNGGSCADADHIVGELMKGFLKKRPLSEEQRERLKAVQERFLCDANIDKLPEFARMMGEDLAKSLQDSLFAMALHNHPGLNSAFANDVDADMVYAQQICGYGREGDVFLAISTSGNAKNLLYAATAAKSKGMCVLLLSGKNGGLLKHLADVSIIVPSFETYEIQERHLPIYHALCLELEKTFF